MFTLQQIKTTHSKVRSGADFPCYIQELKTMGVAAYDHHVSDGRIIYRGVNGFTLSADGQWPPIEIADRGSVAQLQQALTIHQQGQTDYPTFCVQAATAGVDKWTVDIEAMRCTYLNKMGTTLLAEEIPTPA